MNTKKKEQIKEIIEHIKSPSYMSSILKKLNARDIDCLHYHIIKNTSSQNVIKCSVKLGMVKK